jgi:hypothetical protein
VKKYVVDLPEAERKPVLALSSKGKASARKIKRAYILFLADADKTDKAIAETLHVGGTTVERTRRKFALNEGPRPGGSRKLGGSKKPFWWRWPVANP